jgi:dihydrofolate reductase
VMADPLTSGGWREVTREEHPAEGETPAIRFLTLERG